MRATRATWTAMVAVACAACGAPRATEAPRARPALVEKSVDAGPRLVPLIVHRPSASRIAHVAWSPDGRSLAIARDDWSVDVWELASRRRTLERRAPGQIVELVWADHRLGVATHNGVVVWDVASGDELVRVAGNEMTVERAAQSLCLSSDLRRAARLEPDRRHAVVVSLLTGRPERTLESDTRARVERFSADGELLLWARQTESQTRLEGPEELLSDDLRTGRRAVGPSVYPSPPTYVYSASGRVASLSHSLGVDVYEVASWRRLVRLGDARNAVLSPTGKRALEFPRSAGELPFVVDLVTGRRGAPIATSRQSVQWSPEEDSLRLFTHGTSLEIVDATTGTIRERLSLPIAAESRVSPDGRSLATFWNGSLRVLDLHQRLPVLEIEGSNGVADDLAFRLDSGGLAMRPRDGDRIYPTPFAWSFGAAGPRLAASGVDPHLYWAEEDTMLVALASNEESLVLDASGRPQRRAPAAWCPAPAGGWEATLTSSSLTLENPREGRAARTLEVGGERLSWSADGKRLLLSTASSTTAWVVTIEGEGRARVDPLQVQKSWTAALSPDGKRAAVLDLAQRVTLWDLAERRVFSQFRVPSSGIGWGGGSDVLFSLRFGDSHAVALFDLAGAPLGNLPCDDRQDAAVERDLSPLLARDRLDFGRLSRALTRPTGEPPGPVVMSPDGTLLAIGRGDVELIRLKDGKSLRLVGFHAGAPVTLAFDDEGHFDGPEASREFVVPRTTSGDPREDRALAERAYRPGMLADFVRAAR